LPACGIPPGRGTGFGGAAGFGGAGADGGALELVAVVLVVLVTVVDVLGSPVEKTKPGGPPSNPATSFD
jgi:hypothetical protein